MFGRLESSENVLIDFPNRFRGLLTGTANFKFRSTRYCEIGFNLRRFVYDDSSACKHGFCLSKGNGKNVERDGTRRLKREGKSNKPEQLGLVVLHGADQSAARNSRYLYHLV